MHQVLSPKLVEVTSGGIFVKKFCYTSGMARLRGGNCLGPSAPTSPPWWHFLFQIQYSFEKLSWFKRDTRIQLYIPMLRWVSLMIYLQIWLSASFSNHYWIQIFSVLFIATIFEFCMSGIRFQWEKFCHLKKYDVPQIFNSDSETNFHFRGPRLF